MLLPVLAAVTALNALPAAASAPRVYAAAEPVSCTLTVVLECGVKDDGSAHDCRIASEDPNTLGAGQAALSMAASFRLKPGADGQPVLVPVRIRTDQCAVSH